MGNVGVPPPTTSQAASAQNRPQNTPNLNAPPPNYQNKNYNQNQNQFNKFQGNFNNKNEQNKNFNQNFRGNQKFGQNQNTNNPPSLMSLNTRPPVIDKRPAETENTEDAKKGKWDNQNRNWNQKNQKRQIDELTEAEKSFDKQFEDWEAQFNKWKEQNAEHPDKQQYKEYEAKWENWRNQLLDRREQMRKKRLGLMGTTEENKLPTPQKPPPIIPVTTPLKTSQPPPTVAQTPAQIPKTAICGQPPKTALVGQTPTNKTTPQKNEPTKESPKLLDWDKEEPPKEEKKEDFTSIFNLPPKEQRTNLRQRRLSARTEEQIEEGGQEFLKASTSDGGIPGLDLVKDGEPKDDEAKEEKKPENSGPDFEAISKGINTILGDPNLINLLSNIKNTQSLSESPQTGSNENSNISADPKIDVPQQDFGTHGDFSQNWMNDFNKPPPNQCFGNVPDNFAQQPPTDINKTSQTGNFEQNRQSIGNFNQNRQNFDHPQEEFDHRGPNFDQNRPHGPNFNQNRPHGGNFDQNMGPQGNYNQNWGQKGGNFDQNQRNFQENQNWGPKGGQFDQNPSNVDHPNFDQRGLNFDHGNYNRGPNFVNRGPNFDNRGPGFDNRGPNFDNRGPNFENRQPFDHNRPDHPGNFQGPNFDRGPNFRFDNRFGGNFGPRGPMGPRPGFDRQFEGRGGPGFGPRMGFQNRNDPGFGNDRMNNNEGFGRRPWENDGNWNENNACDNYPGDEEEEEEDIQNMDDPFPDNPEEEHFDDSNNRLSGGYVDNMDRWGSGNNLNKFPIDKPTNPNFPQQNKADNFKDRYSDWDEALILKPTTVIDYEHKSLKGNF